MGAALGIDIGGTFVDIALAIDGGLTIAKFPSTPSAPDGGVFRGLSELISAGTLTPGVVGRISHGSTIVTNALLEGRWARTALVTTAGFRDVLEIGRQNRSSLYDLSIERPEQIVPRDLRFEVHERIDARGEIVTPLDAREVEALASRLRAAGVETIAVAFLFSYLNPDHERRVKDILAEAVGVPVTASAEVMAEFREYERTATTVACAALRPLIDGYLERLERGASSLGLPSTWQIMQSSGAATGAASARAEPARLALSGPAAGVEGARWVGRAASEPNLITMDMGGTSCDVALIREGRVARATSGSVGGHPIALQMTEIHTIGAGGGSIAWLDPGGALRVGPRSAGAEPGPASYGRGGTQATVTDAHVVLGRVSSDRPIGGLPPLLNELAVEAIRLLADPMGVSIEVAALGILEVADAAMERAIRVMTVERGHDPREFALLAFGGGGPLHAASIAARLRIPRVVVPAAAGVLSAVGLLVADVGRDLSRSIVRPLETIDPAAVERLVRELAEDGAESLAEDAIDAADLRIERSADLRYVGQSHEINVAIPGEPTKPIERGTIARLEEAFHDQHRTRFGYAAPERGVEWVTARVRVAAVGDPLALVAPDDDTRAAADAAAVWFDRGGPVEARVMTRRALAPACPFHGPALIVGSDTTIVVPPGAVGTIDRLGTITLEVG